MTGDYSKNMHFDCEAVFEVDDYMYFYSDHLTEEVTAQQVDFLVRELALDRPVRILDLACSYWRHANALTALGHTVTGIDLMPGFLEMARLEANRKRAKLGLNRRNCTVALSLNRFPLIHADWL
jgi:SAM-dependent methyltransferase